LNKLPKPKLDAVYMRGIPFYTDEALFERTGVRVAFTGRAGGVSEGDLGELNLGFNTADAQERVEENRARLFDAVCAGATAHVWLNQVHGARVLDVESADEAHIEGVLAEGRAGADAVCVSVPGVAALLCFADCVPLVIVSPTGNFCVVHAGWKGVMAEIAREAVLRLVAADARTDAGASDAFATQNSNQVAAHASQFNCYIGPHIHAECFEVSSDLYEKFTQKFGKSAAFHKNFIDLNACLRQTLTNMGVLPENIADVNICTVCNSGEFYSYRASGGACGRHGALCVRL
jgi:hypothetical protein